MKLTLLEIEWDDKFVTLLALVSRILWLGSIYSSRANKLVISVKVTCLRVIIYEYFTSTVSTGVIALKKGRSYIGVVGLARLAATIRKELACIEDHEESGDAAGESQDECSS